MTISRHESITKENDSIKVKYNSSTRINNKASKKAEQSGKPNK